MMSQFASGKELFDARSRNQVLPSWGVKESEVLGTWGEEKEVEARLQDCQELVSEVKITRKDQLATGTWIETSKMVQLNHQAGSFWEYMGVETDIGRCLFPEEAVYLIEMGELEVLHGSMPLSLQVAQSVMLLDRFHLDLYLIYAHLARTGCRVVRHQPYLRFTKYEKQIRLDQHQVKKKKRKLKLKDGLQGPDTSNNSNKHNPTHEEDSQEVKIIGAKSPDLDSALKDFYSVLGEPVKNTPEVIDLEEEQETDMGNKQEKTSRTEPDEISSYELKRKQYLDLFPSMLGTDSLAILAENAELLPPNSQPHKRCYRVSLDHLNYYSAYLENDQVNDWRQSNDWRRGRGNFRGRQRNGSNRHRGSRNYHNFSNRNQRGQSRGGHFYRGPGTSNTKDDDQRGTSFRDGQHIGIGNLMPSVKRKDFNDSEHGDDGHPYVGKKMSVRDDNQMGREDYLQQNQRTDTRMDNRAWKESSYSRLDEGREYHSVAVRGSENDLVDERVNRTFCQENQTQMDRWQTDERNPENMWNNEERQYGRRNQSGREETQMNDRWKRNERPLGERSADRIYDECSQRRSEEPQNDDRWERRERIPDERWSGDRRHGLCNERDPYGDWRKSSASWFQHDDRMSATSTQDDTMAHQMPREPPQIDLNVAPSWKVKMRKKKRRDNYHSYPSCLVKLSMEVSSWKEYKKIVNSMSEDSMLTKGFGCSLWRGQTKPLLRPTMATSLGAILEKCNLHFDSSESEAAKAFDFREPPLVLHFDVYLPHMNYKKTNPSIPGKRITVMRGDTVPSPWQIKEVGKRFPDEVPVICAVITAGDIRLYNLTSICLPSPALS